MIAKGDHVRLTYEGRSVTAIVVLASPNVLGWHVGGMPLYKERDTDPYRSLITGEIVRVEVLPCC